MALCPALLLWTDPVESPTLSKGNLTKEAKMPRVFQEGVQGWNLAFSKLVNYGDANGGVSQNLQNCQNRSHFFDTFWEFSKWPGWLYAQP